MLEQSKTIDEISNNKSPHRIDVIKRKDGGFITEKGNYVIEIKDEVPVVTGKLKDNNVCSLSPDEKDDAKLLGFKKFNQFNWFIYNKIYY